MKRRIAALLAALLLLTALSLFAACTAGGQPDPNAEALPEGVGGVPGTLPEESPEEQPAAGTEALPAVPDMPAAADDAPVYGEAYSDRDGVAAYLRAYGELPPNYITKSEARALGWDSGRGNLWEVAPGRSIGGDRFGNREGLLPEADGRTWYECDVNYGGGYRGAERIVFSNDGLIYYTDDHYASFTLLYSG